MSDDTVSPLVNSYVGLLGSLGMYVECDGLIRLESGDAFGVNYRSKSHPLYLKCNGNTGKEYFDVARDAKYKLPSPVVLALRDAIEDKLNKQLYSVITVLFKALTDNTGMLSQSTVAIIDELYDCDELHPVTKVMNTKWRKLSVESGFKPLTLTFDIDRSKELPSAITLFADSDLFSENISTRSLCEIKSAEWENLKVIGSYLLRSDHGESYPCVIQEDSYGNKLPSMPQVRALLDCFNVIQSKLNKLIVSLNMNQSRIKGCKLNPVDLSWYSDIPNWPRLHKELVDKAITDCSVEMKKEHIDDINHRWIRNVKIIVENNKPLFVCSTKPNLNEENKMSIVNESNNEPEDWLASLVGSPSPSVDEAAKPAPQAPTATANVIVAPPVPIATANVIVAPPAPILAAVKGDRAKPVTHNQPMVINGATVVEFRMISMTDSYVPQVEWVGTSKLGLSKISFDRAPYTGPYIITRYFELYEGSEALKKILMKDHGFTLSEAEIQSGVNVYKRNLLANSRYEILTEFELVNLQPATIKLVMRNTEKQDENLNRLRTAKANKLNETRTGTSNSKEITVSPKTSGVGNNTEPLTNTTTKGNTMTGLLTGLEYHISEKPPTEAEATAIITKQNRGFPSNLADIRKYDEFEYGNCSDDGIPNRYLRTNGDQPAPYNVIPYNRGMFKSAPQNQNDVMMLQPSYTDRTHPARFSSTDVEWLNSGAVGVGATSLPKVATARIADDRYYPNNDQYVNPQPAARAGTVPQQKAVAPVTNALSVPVKVQLTGGELATQSRDRGDKNVQHVSEDGVSFYYDDAGKMTVGHVPLFEPVLQPAGHYLDERGHPMASFKHELYVTYTTSNGELFFINGEGHRVVGHVPVGQRKGGGMNNQQSYTQGGTNNQQSYTQGGQYGQQNRSYNEQPQGNRVSEMDYEFFGNVGASAGADAVKRLYPNGGTNVDTQQLRATLNNFKQMMYFGVFDYDQQVVGTNETVGSKVDFIRSDNENYGNTVIPPALFVMFAKLLGTGDFDKDRDGYIVPRDISSRYVISLVSLYAEQRGIGKEYLLDGVGKFIDTYGIPARSHQPEGNYGNGGSHRNQRGQSTYGGQMPQHQQPRASSYLDSEGRDADGYDQNGKDRFGFTREQPEDEMYGNHDQRPMSEYEIARSERTNPYMPTNRVPYGLSTEKYQPPVSTRHLQRNAEANSNRGYTSAQNHHAGNPPSHMVAEANRSRSNTGNPPSHMVAEANRSRSNGGLKMVQYDENANVRTVGRPPAPAGNPPAHMASHVGNPPAHMASHVGNPPAHMASHVGNPPAHMASHVGNPPAHMASHVGNANQQQYRGHQQHPRRAPLKRPVLTEAEIKRNMSRVHKTNFSTEAVPTPVKEKVEGIGLDTIAEMQKQIDLLTKANQAQELANELAHMKHTVGTANPYSNNGNSNVAGLMTMEPTPSELENVTGDPDAVHLSTTARDERLSVKKSDGATDAPLNTSVSTPSLVDTEVVVDKIIDVELTQEMYEERIDYIERAKEIATEVGNTPINTGGLVEMSAVIDKFMDFPYFDLAVTRFGMDSFVDDVFVERGAKETPPIYAWMETYVTDLANTSPKLANSQVELCHMPMVANDVYEGITYLYRATKCIVARLMLTDNAVLQPSDDELNGVGKLPTSYLVLAKGVFLGMTNIYVESVINGQEFKPLSADSTERLVEFVEGIFTDPRNRRIMLSGMESIESQGLVVNSEYDIRMIADFGNRDDLTVTPDLPCAELGKCYDGIMYEDDPIQYLTDAIGLIDNAYGNTKQPELADTTAEYIEDQQKATLVRLTEERRVSDEKAALELAERKAKLEEESPSVLEEDGLKLSDAEVDAELAVIATRVVESEMESEKIGDVNEPVRRVGRVELVNTQPKFFKDFDHRTTDEIPTVSARAVETMTRYPHLEYRALSFDTQPNRVERIERPFYRNVSNNEVLKEVGLLHVPMTCSKDFVLNGYGIYSGGTPLPKFMSYHRTEMKTYYGDCPSWAAVKTFLLWSIDYQLSPYAKVSFEDMYIDGKILSKKVRNGDEHGLLDVFPDWYTEDPVTDSSLDVPEDVSERDPDAKTLVLSSSPESKVGSGKVVEAKKVEKKVEKKAKKVKVVSKVETPKVVKPTVRKAKEVVDEKPIAKCLTKSLGEELKSKLNESKGGENEDSSKKEITEKAGGSKKKENQVPFNNRTKEARLADFINMSNETGGTSNTEEQTVNEPKEAIEEEVDEYYVELDEEATEDEGDGHYSIDDHESDDEPTSDTLVAMKTGKTRYETPIDVAHWSNPAVINEFDEYTKERFDVKRLVEFMEITTVEGQPTFDGYACFKILFAGHTLSAYDLKDYRSMYLSAVMRNNRSNHRAVPTHEEFKEDNVRSVARITEEERLIAKVKEDAEIRRKDVLVKEAKRFADTRAARERNPVVVTKELTKFRETVERMLGKNANSIINFRNCELYDKVNGCTSAVMSVARSMTTVNDVDSKLAKAEEKKEVSTITKNHVPRNPDGPSDKELKLIELKKQLDLALKQREMLQAASLGSTSKKGKALDCSSAVSDVCNNAVAVMSVNNSNVVGDVSELNGGHGDAHGYSERVSRKSDLLVEDESHVMDGYNPDNEVFSEDEIVGDDVSYTDDLALTRDMKNSDSGRVDNMSPLYDYGDGGFETKLYDDGETSVEAINIEKDRVRLKAQWARKLKQGTSSAPLITTPRIKRSKVPKTYKDRVDAKTNTFDVSKVVSYRTDDVSAACVRDFILMGERHTDNLENNHTGIGVILQPTQLRNEIGGVVISGKRDNSRHREPSQALIDANYEKFRLDLSVLQANTPKATDDNAENADNSSVYVAERKKLMIAHHQHITKGFTRSRDEQLDYVCSIDHIDLAMEYPLNNVELRVNPLGGELPVVRFDRRNILASLLEFDPNVEVNGSHWSSADTRGLTDEDERLDELVTEHLDANESYSQYFRVRESILRDVQEGLIRNLDALVSNLAIESRRYVMLDGNGNAQVAPIENYLGVNPPDNMRDVYNAMRKTTEMAIFTESCDIDAIMLSRCAHRAARYLLSKRYNNHISEIVDEATYVNKPVIQPR